MYFVHAVGAAPKHASRWAPRSGRVTLTGSMRDPLLLTWMSKAVSGKTAREKIHQGGKRQNCSSVSRRANLTKAFR